MAADLATILTKNVGDLTKAEAAQLLLAVRAAEDGFLGFVRLHHPEWDIPDFQLDMIDKLDKLERRELLHPDTGEPVYNVAFSLPPRHNKSTLATRLFAAYCMARAPWTKALVSSYSGELANDFGYATRNYITEPRTALAYPDIQLDPSTRARDNWSTLQGGQYLAVGMSGTTAGRPANLLIFDDPYPNRQAAQSPTQRLAVQSHWDSSLWLRREPDVHGRKPIAVLIHTRWHPDDLTGRILASEDFKDGLWLHVAYKGISTRPTQITISRGQLDPSDPRFVPTNQLSKITPKQRFVFVEEETALWPARFPLDELKRLRRANPVEFAAQYQQEPYIQGGSLIKTSWWRFYDPRQDTPPLSSIIIGVDAAYKKTDSADYTAALIAGLSADGDIYILDLIRQKLDFPELKRMLIQINTRFRGRGLKGIYIEDKASGQSVIQELKTASGLSVIPYKVVSDKTARAQAVTPLIEGGRVLLPQGAPWLEDFLQECEQFPNGTHDDQVDALSITLEVLARTPVYDVNALNIPFDPSGSLLAQVRAAGQATPATNPFAPSSTRPLIQKWGDLVSSALGE